VCVCVCVCVGSLMADLSQNQLSTPPPKTNWSVGAECVARRDDGRWYRAKISDVSNDLYRVLLLILFLHHSYLSFLMYIIFQQVHKRCT